MCLRSSVRDNGIGIAPGEIALAFKRFYQAEPGAPGRPGGWSLGLSIVQRIVRVHPGPVEVSSTVGQGSTFSIHLSASVHMRNSPCLISPWKRT